MTRGVAVTHPQVSGPLLFGPPSEFVGAAGPVSFCRVFHMPGVSGGATRQLSIRSSVWLKTRGASFPAVRAGLTSVFSQSYLPLEEVLGVSSFV